MSEEIQTQTTALALSPMQVEPTDIAVTAENADEMAQCQTAIIRWCKTKVTAVAAEAAELKAAFEHAQKQKWKSDTLKRHHKMAAKRLNYYERMLTATEHGYQIVPNFPVTAFAIRTNRKNPLKILTDERWMKREQETHVGLPAGEGEYKNPFPVVMRRTLVKATETKKEEVEYWADAWADMEFPISMAKPQIMEATTRAMALKIFDDLGILPGAAPKGDPMIIARLRFPRNDGYQAPRFVSFVIAWHLDSRTL